MLPVCLDNGLIRIENVMRKDLPMILGWYNQADDFKYATGVETHISLAELTRMYGEAVSSTGEFFLGIRRSDTGRMIGILKGHIRPDAANAVWINILAIDGFFRRKGYGRTAVEILLSHMRDRHGSADAYLSVDGSNEGGIRFWQKNGFRLFKKLGNSRNIKRYNRNVLIMHRKIPGQFHD